MRRKNPEAFQPPLAAVDAAPDYDTYDAKEKTHPSSRSNYEGGKEGLTVEEKKCDTSPPERPKEAHISFYDRQQIRTLEYSQTRTATRPLNIKTPPYKTNKPAHLHQRQARKRPLLLDITCLCCLAALCWGLSSVFNDTSWTTILANQTPTTILLPPSDKIPLYLLESVHRRVMTDNKTDKMTLLLLGIQRQHAMLQQRILQEQKQVKETVLDNSNTTSVANKEEVSTEFQSQLRKGFYYPRKMGVKELREQMEADYGLEDLKFLSDHYESRRIYRQQWEAAGIARTLEQPRDDDVEQYWALDDDWLRCVTMTISE